MYLDPPDGDLYLDHRNSGGFVTAPSSPKARHNPHTSHNPYFQQPQPMGSMYSLYPTAEQQLQAQLMQRLHPLLSPPVYQTLPPSYNLCTFPTPYYAKRRDDDGPRRVMEDVSSRLDPPPVRRKGPDPRDDRDIREKSRERRNDRGDPRDVREKSRENRDDRGDPRDVREKSRETRDDRGDPRDVREKSRETRDDRGDPRDDREKSRERRDDRGDPRDVREKSREGRDVRERSRENRDRGASPSPSSSPLTIPSPRSPKSPSPISPASPSLSPPPAVHSPKSSYTNAFASALSTIRTLRVSGGASGSGGDRGRKTPTSAAPGPITRSTSEKVPNRSELMDLVQRTAWARQTK